VSDSDLTKLLASSARTNPKTAPSTKGGKSIAPAGGFIFMRPLCDDLDCPPVPDPDDDTPPDPCAGQSFVWQPDIAVQLNTGESTCPSAADLARIQSGVGGNLARFHLPDPDVRVSCEGGKIFIRIWGTRVPPNSCSEQARQRAHVPDLVAGGNFGLFLNSSLIGRLAQKAFQNAPKQLSGNGAPSPFGPIHLTGLSIEFKSPHTIVTRISGYDERPWPDAYFTQVITDELLALRNCHTESHTDVDKGPPIIGELVLIIMSIAIPLVIPLAAFVLIGDIEALLNNPGNNTEGGAGCRLLQTLPDEIPLPQEGGLAPPIAMAAKRVSARIHVPDTTIHPKRQKLVIAYAQPTVDNRGLFVGALAGRQDRVPAAHVIGPSNLVILFPGSHTFGTFQAVPDDFFGRLTFKWSAGPGTQIHSPTGSRTKITFQRGNVPRGDSFERTVSVRITDVEGSSVTASRSVTVFVNEDDNLPPICQIKPWLPQCNPQEL
jgi:hypothetical protein